MKTSKSIKATYWITTIIIFLFEGVMPALTSQTEMAKQGIQHLGYPQYFGSVFVFFKVAGTLALIIPQVPDRIKEWAYAGFAFDFIFASISITLVDGFSVMSLFPLIFLGLLAVSYITREKILRNGYASKTVRNNTYVVAH